MKKNIVKFRNDNAQMAQLYLRDGSGKFQLYAAVIPEGETIQTVFDDMFTANNIQIDGSVTIGNKVTLGDGVFIGDGCILESGCYIGNRVQIDKTCLIGEGIKIAPDSKIKEGVITYEPYAVISGK